MVYPKYSILWQSGHIVVICPEHGATGLSTLLSVALNAATCCINLFTLSSFVLNIATWCNGLVFIVVICNERSNIVDKVNMVDIVWRWFILLFVLNIATCCNRLVHIIVIVLNIATCCNRLIHGDTFCHNHGNTL